jgi:hypothetical protein
MEFCAIDHVQLAMPAGQEQTAREFFVGVLGMTETPKPESGAGVQGCWFVSGQVHIHLGVDPDFRPAAKAHPAIIIGDLTDLTSRLQAAGYPTTPGGELPGRTRAFAPDCFGNRIEWIQLH